MNFKYLKILGLLAVVLLFLGSIYWALTSNPAPAQKVPQESKISLPTQTGQVQVNDITKNPVEKTTDALVFGKNADFDLVYFPEDKSILITINSQPAQRARDMAEQKLLEELGIGRGEACKLKVSLTVPYSVDSALAGKNYGLSFCPSGLPF